MDLSQTLSSRSGAVCELCSSSDSLSAYAIDNESLAEKNVLTCQKCKDSIEELPENSHYWHCLQESIWSEHTPVKVLAYRILAEIVHENWASNLLEQIYLEEEDLKWAKQSPSEAFVSKDAHGNTILAGDTVTLIKDLDVKGAKFTAKRGTIVKNVRLTDNPEHIEGRVNGVQIVIITKYVKK